MTGIVLAGVIPLAGCSRDEVASYEVPKETPPPSAAIAPMEASPHAPSGPALKWPEIPSGWTASSQGSAMRLATFLISGEDGQTAEMAIIPMGGFAGSDVQLVNMWRMQVGLPELDAGAAEALGTAVAVGDVSGRLYEMTGTSQDKAARLLVASANKENVNYFFKLMGDDALVLAQKEPFLDFLKGIEFGEAAPMPEMPAGHPAVASGSGQPWHAPASWEEEPPSQFLLAKYRVPAEGGGSAQVTVSKLGGTGGGLLPNVNRWRGQLNLAPVDDAGMAPLLSSIPAGSEAATLVTLEGTDTGSGEPGKMLAAVVTLPTETWYLKLTGPTDVVDAKAAEFREFVKDTDF